MYQRRYDKVFIMLRQETNGFSFGQQQVWGSSTMEIKNGRGKLSLSVQGLRPLAKKEPYSIYLVAGKGAEMQPIFCGDLQVDAYGKGNLQWEFHPDQIGENGFLAEDLHTLVVLAQTEDTAGIQAPLVGYFGERMQWKSAFLQRKQEAKKPVEEVKKEAKKEVEKEREAPSNSLAKLEVDSLKEGEKPIAKQEERPVEKRETVQETLKEPKRSAETYETGTIPRKNKESDFHQNFKEMLAKFQGELQLLEKAGILQEKDLEKINGKGGFPQGETLMVEMEKTEQAKKAEPIRKEEKMEQQEQEGTSLDFLELTKEAFAQCPRMERALDDGKRRWKKISKTELSVLPKEIFQCRNHPLFVMAEQRYGHFLLGEEEGSQFYFGLPMDKMMVTQENEVPFPIVERLPCQAQRKQGECEEYWICKI